MSTTVISQAYLVEQQGLHRNPRYGVASIQFAPLVEQLLRVANCLSLSDYGAGKCNLLHALGGSASGVAYQPYDPVFPEYGKPKRADLVTCIDVLEHIEPDCLDAVLDELASITGRLALLTVHTGPAKKLLSDGRNAHLTQQPAEWWLEHLDRRFDVLHVKPIRKGFFVIVAEKDSVEEIGRTVDLAALGRVVDSARPRAFWSRVGTRVDEILRRALGHAWSQRLVRRARIPLRA